MESSPAIEFNQASFLLLFMSPHYYQTNNIFITPLLLPMNCKVPYIHIYILTMMELLKSCTMPMTHLLLYFIICTSVNILIIPDLSFKIKIQFSFKSYFIYILQLLSLIASWTLVVKSAGLQIIEHLITYDQIPVANSIARKFVSSLCKGQWLSPGTQFPPPSQK